MKLYDSEAEDRLLGYYLSFPELLSAPVPEACFTQVKRRELLRVIKRLYADSGTLDMRNIVDVIYRENLGEAVGSVQEVVALMAGAGDRHSGADYYAKTLRECRRVAMLAKTLADATLNLQRALTGDTSVNIDELRGSLAASLNAASAENSAAKIWTWQEMSDEFRTYLADLMAGKVKGRGWLTGLANFDSLVTTVQAGTLWVLAARPSVGKTVTAFELTRLFAGGIPGRQERLKVGVIEKEMDMLELMRRCVVSGASEADVMVNLSLFATEKNLEPWVAESMLRYLESTRDLDIFLDDSADQTFSAVMETVARMAYAGCKIIFIDYLQLLDYDLSKNENRNLEIGKMTKALKEAARRYGVCIFLLSQLSRPQDSRAEITRPTLKMLRDSGSIEQDADGVAFLWSDDPEYRRKPQAKLTMTVEKQRGGATNEINFLFDKTKAHLAPWYDTEESQQDAN